MGDLSNKVILVTGATSGMGKYIATELARRGATVLLHGRNSEALARLKSDIKHKTGNSLLRTYIADFSSLEEVAAMANVILQEEPHLDVLINNAGIGGGTPLSGREVSRDGYELRFAVNYLAPYALTRVLLSLLEKSAPSRIVNVASIGQQPIDFSDVMLERRFDKARSYMQSKLALIMFTFDLANELKAADVTVNVLHPATFMNTKQIRAAMIPPLHTVRAGGDPTIWLATSPETAHLTGKYFDQMRESKANPQAYDTESRLKLKRLTDELIAKALVRANPE